MLMAGVIVSARAWKYKRKILVFTREEIAGLMADLLYVDAQPTGTTKLTEWVRDHAADLGKVYASELARRR
jgi:NADH dehydrogenase